MPRRISEFRLLAEPLRVWLSEVDAEGNDRWPKYKELFRFLRESLDSGGSEREYKTLRTRGFGPARLVEGVCGYLACHGRRHLEQFLQSQGRTDGETIGPTDLLEQFSALCDDSQIRTDWRRGGWREIAHMFSAALLGVASYFPGISEWRLGNPRAPSPTIPEPGVCSLAGLGVLAGWLWVRRTRATRC